jgi:hypothetical protein
MTKSILAGCCVALLALAAVAQTQTQTQTQTPMPEMPKMPEPQKEHAWLKQLVGEWENEGNTEAVQGMPAMTFKGTETARQLGGFFVVTEGKGEMMGTQMQSLLTLGYDSDKKMYVGTWLDSMSHHLWKYEGSVDASGKTLTLNTEGPCPLAPGKILKFKEVLELKSPDHKVFTSTVELEPGKWQKMVTVNSRRKK